MVGDDVRRASEAADALVSELNKTNITASRHAADLNFGPDVIIVRIGPMPNPAIERIIREFKEKTQDK